MCFSAGASFTAAGVLAIAGGALLMRFPRNCRTPLALVPIFFALQQFSEGVLWLGLESGVYPNSWSVAAEYSFLFFAVLFWPVWVPLSLLIAEDEPWRKGILGLLLACGVVHFIYTVFTFAVGPATNAEVMHHSISYGDVSTYRRILYALIVLPPFFVSSIPRMWILGVLVTLSYVVSDMVYYYAFTSVWCFASAVIIIGLYFVLRNGEYSRSR